MSLPTRERGLKLLKNSEVQYDIESLPTRERGLKFRRSFLMRIVLHVAPHAGARIEIFFHLQFNITVQSLPTRERGLK